VKRWLIAVALLAYPRAFRRHYGDEIRADVARASATTGVQALLGTLARVGASGLAERWSALHRAALWPNYRPHLYEPAGRHAMFWDTLRSDLQHAIRLATKAPLVTAMTVLALALGIGVTTAIFAVVNSVLMRPLPYANPDELVVVWSNASQQGRPQNTISPANYRDFASMNQTLQGLEAYFSFVTPLEMVVDGGNSEVTIGVTVTPRLFELLGRAPALGRHLSNDPAAFEVVLSHAFWQRRFGSDPAVVGRTIQVGTYPATIVGVMPRDFVFPYGTMLGPSGFTRVTTIDLWAPMRFQGALAAANRMLTAQGQVVRDVHWLGAIGRMKPGVTLDQVRADLSTVAAQVEQAYPETNKGWGATVIPVLDQTVGNIRGPLLVLLAGVAFVLLIATVNVANLVLARSIARQKELATRVALGAGRARLVQQALTEGILLALVGGLTGLLLARWGITALVAFAPPDLPRLDEVSPDGTVLAAAALVTLFAGIFIGLIPAVSASRIAPQAALQENSRGAVGSAFRHRTRAALVVTEVAMAVTLTIGAGLLLRSFTSLLAVDAGFRPENMLTWQMNLPDRLRTPEQRDAFYAEFLTRMTALPGVVGVGGTSRLPLGSTGLTTSLDIDGRPRPSAEWPEVQFRRSVGDYFQTMGIPLVRGRTFTDDDHRTAPPVAVINQTLAARLFPGEDPVGKRVRMGVNQNWVTIIGVIGDVKHGALDEELQPEMYMNHMQGSIVSPYIALRTTGDAASMMELVRAEALAIDRDLPVYRMQTMEAVRSASLAQRRFILWLVGLFGLLALSLAAIGVYGVMSLLVSERTQEVGVRLALGANPTAVLRMLVAHAMRLSVVGVTVGVTLSLALMPLLGAQLYAVQPRDPVTLAGVPAVLIVVALVAALIPARRAMRVDPVKALRYE
jgi:predicted permease